MACISPRQTLPRPNAAPGPDLRPLPARRSGQRLPAPAVVRVEEEGEPARWPCSREFLFLTYKNGVRRPTVCGRISPVLKLSLQADWTPLTRAGAVEHFTRQWQKGTLLWPKKKHYFSTAKTRGSRKRDVREVERRTGSRRRTRDPAMYNYHAWESTIEAVDDLDSDSG